MEAPVLRVIFLDIDGVLNRYFPEGIPDEEDVKRFDPIAISNLISIIQRVQESTGEPVGLVISSSWKETGDLEHLRKLFRSTPFAVHIIGATPPLIPRDRSAEILSWLYQNFGRYQIESFVVLDDYPVGLDLFRERYLQVDPQRLLTRNDAEQAARILLLPGRVDRESLVQYNLDLGQYRIYQREECQIL
jgi:hypothetical protein